ncbi:pilus assembly protein TadG-related protein [Streptomyces sp. NPDC002835]
MWIRAPRRYRQDAHDRGGVSVFVAIVAVPLLILGGLLVVDGTGKLRTAQRADALAMEAARAGAQAIDPGQAVGGDGVVADPASAAAAAHAYLSRAGVSGDVTIGAGGSRVEVIVHARYRTRFLTLVGVTAMPATGHGQASLLHGVTAPQEGTG